MQFILPLLLILSIFLLAFVANRLLGLRLDQPHAVATDENNQWLKELSVLRLEERHPYC